MNAFAYDWGSLLPGTWYLMARVDQTVRGTPVDLSWKPLLVLLAFAVGLIGLLVWRLKSARAGSSRTSGSFPSADPAEAYP
jgi:ABC-2 type transport system permease protein